MTFWNLVDGFEDGMMFILRRAGLTRKEGKENILYIDHCYETANKTFPPMRVFLLASRVRCDYVHAARWPRLSTGCVPLDVVLEFPC